MSMFPAVPYNERDASSRELITANIIYDTFNTHYPVLAACRENGVTERFFQGTSAISSFLYNDPHGSATQPGETITPQLTQLATNGKWYEKFYESDLAVDDTVYNLFNAKGDTQIFDLQDLHTYALVKTLERMAEMDAYKHGQPSAGTVGGQAGVLSNRWLSSNGFNEAFNNGYDPDPFGNVFLQYGTVARNGVVGQAYNSVPQYCGSLAGVAGSPTPAIFQKALAQLSQRGARAKLGFTSPFGWGALAVMWRSSSWINIEQVKEGTDFGWRSVNFGGLTIVEDPCCPTSAGWKYMPGGNPAAYGNSSIAQFTDGSGQTSQLSPFLTPTFTLNGAAVAAGTASPSGSNIPSATVIDPGEPLYMISPDSMELLPPKKGSGWEFDSRLLPLPDNVSMANRIQRLATNVHSCNPSHGIILYGIAGVGS
jgi:hypothetical protein